MAVSLNGFFNPRSVALIGASQKPKKVGTAIIQNLIASKYQGNIYPVNPQEKEIAGYPCFPAITAIKEPVELAVLMVPARICLEVARQCGETGVKNLIVISAGFKETGKEGLAREKELLNLCREYAMQLVGPNCVGIMDTKTPLNVSFATGFPRQGEIAFISQSGAMLIAILDWSFTAGIGFSKLVSLGNKAALNEADFIQAIVEDEQTKVILCYLEDVTDGDRFLKVAQKATRSKPVVVLKAGASQAGAQAASSHTGALAGSDLAYDVAFRQTGIIRAFSVAELFDLAQAFTTQPIPAGKRVAIVTNSGGPGIIAADKIEHQGLEMARFTKETIASLREVLPVEANFYNPVDVLGDARADRYLATLERVLPDPNVNSLLVLLCPTAVTDPVGTAETIVALRKKYTDKPILVVYIGGVALEAGTKILAKYQIPYFTFPEPAVLSLEGLARYAEIKEMNLEKPAPPWPGVSQDAVKAVFYEVIRQHRVVLLGSESARVGKAYGLPVCPTRLATTPEEAVAIAAEMGYPVVLKIASPKVLHKTDVGGVQVGLQNAAAVKNGFVSILESVQRYFPGTPLHGVEVQKMMPPGTELIVGMTRDIHFGPLLAFGLGGIYVNLLKDVAFRLAHRLSLKEIKAMIAETRAYTVLGGYRGAEPGDIPAVIEVIARVAQLVLDFPEITELDINPLIAYRQGVSALDVKIIIEALKPEEPEAKSETRQVVM